MQVSETKSSPILVWNKRQAPCLESAQRNDDHVVFARELVSGGYEYTSLSTQEQYANYILGGNTHCNEHLCQKPTHTYLDIESPCSLSMLGLSKDEFITEFSKFIQEQFSKLLGIKVKKKQLRWSDSCRETKTSFHLVVALDDYYWADRAQLKHFINKISEASLLHRGFYTFVEKNNAYTQESAIDLQVYTKNRLFRTVGCSKIENGIPLAPYKKRLTVKTILDHLVCITDTDERQELTFQKQKKTKRTLLDMDLLEKIAREHDCTVHSTEGSLITCRNLGKERLCTLTGEKHLRQNCFFVQKRDGVHLFCHGCPGHSKLVHEFDNQSEFGTYESYKTLLKAPDIDISVIQKYMKESIFFIDQPGDPHYVTSTTVPCDGFKNKLVGKGLVKCQNLFHRASDIILGTGKEAIKFSAVLAGLAKRRALRTYNKTVWLPFSKKSNTKPILDKNTMNLFPGYALESVQCDWKGIKFEDTMCYQLLHRNLCNENPETFDFLLSAISHKLQKSWIKLPIAHVWAGSKPGTGKSSLLTFLSRIFGVNQNQKTCISFSNISSFCNRFNHIMGSNLWISLEELKSNGKLREFDNYLKDFISNPFTIQEKKGVDKTYTRNYSTCLLFSNELNVVKCDALDRRMVFYECSDKCRNDATFFTALFAEFDNVQIMKAIFEYFLAKDISKWNYRDLPVTKTRQKIISVSRDINLRFVEYLLRFEVLRDTVIEKSELFMMWENFTTSEGIVHYRRDCNYVCSMLEMTLGMDSENLHYSFKRENLLEKLREYGITEI
jgi:hypothetical protein